MIDIASRPDVTPNTAPVTVTDAPGRVLPPVCLFYKPATVT